MEKRNMFQEYSVEYYCRYCKTITPMHVISDEFAFDSYWLKCQVCHICFMIRKKEVEGKSFVSDVNISAHKKNIQNEQLVREYKPSGIYEVGQILYHPNYEVKGKVIKKVKGSGSYNKIVVKFKKIGERTLVEGLSPGI